MGARRRLEVTLLKITYTHAHRRRSHGLILISGDNGHVDAEGSELGEEASGLAFLAEAAV
jgi:hypothetical protein